MSDQKKKLFAGIALAAILALGAFLRFYELGAHSIGNTYYAATVKSMLTSPANFFFGSFEPGGSVTVDKPPLGFWVQALSASLLGVNGFSLALPNALAGIGSIALVYSLVKEQFNRGAGLVAALTLAVVPVTVSTERNNTIDGLLVFVLLLATWAFWKSIQSGKFRYLLLGAFIIGLGFNIKMLQAYMILPALFALYFFGAKKGWFTKIWQLGAAGILILIVSLSWAVTVDLIPEENRPYIGSSEDNTVLELIIGHNGLSRLGLNDNGKRGNGDGGPQQPPQNDGQRAFNPQQPPNQPQVGLGAVPQQPPQQALDACTGLALGDKCNFDLPRQNIDGICISPPQVDALVCTPEDRLPQIAQAAGNVPLPPNDGNPANGAFNTSETGQAGIPRLFSEPLVTEASWILPLALVSILLTAVVIASGAKQSPASDDEIASSQKRAPRNDNFLGLLLWALWLLPALAYFSFTTGLFHRYYLIMLGPALAALTGMAFWSVAQLAKRSRWLGFGALALLALVTLGFQAFILSGYTTASWVLPLAIIGTLLGLAAFALSGELSNSHLHNAALTITLLAFLLAPATWATMATMNENPNVALPTATINDTQPTTFMTPNNTVMNDNEAAIMDFLLANTDPDSYLLATVNARSAAPYILETDRAVLTFGGFSGSDPIFEVEDIVEMVEEGELRYILFSDNMNQAHREIAAWVQNTCLPTSVPGVEVQGQQNARSQNPQNAGGLRPPSNNEVLYDCGN